MWASLSKSCKDLLLNMMTVDVKKRFSAEDALGHGWFSETEEDFK
jgi:serine/threonine protein kinase